MTYSSYELVPEPEGEFLRSLREYARRRPTAASRIVTSLEQFAASTNRVGTLVGRRGGLCCVFCPAVFELGRGEAGVLFLVDDRERKVWVRRLYEPGLAVDPTAELEFAADMLAREKEDRK